MPLQNRVDPFNALIAVPARGSLTGNRGCLHDDQQRIRPGQTWRSRRWISCRLEWKGVRRAVMTPGRWTELFFLDEATALAAGHRPCAYCRREAFQRFRSALVSGNPGRLSAAPGVEEIDRLLHGDRLTEGGAQRRYETEPEALPSGVFVAWRETPWLKEGDNLRPWSAAGYGPAEPLPRGKVEVLTPRCLVGALGAGYAPGS